LCARRCAGSAAMACHQGAQAARWRPGRAHISRAPPWRIGGLRALQWRRAVHHGSRRAALQAAHRDHGACCCDDNKPEVAAQAAHPWIPHAGVQDSSPCGEWLAPPGEDAGTHPAPPFLYQCALWDTGKVSCGNVGKGNQGLRACRVGCVARGRRVPQQRGGQAAWRALTMGLNSGSRTSSPCEAASMKLCVHASMVPRQPARMCPRCPILYATPRVKQPLGSLTRQAAAWVTDEAGSRLGH
jgi:hypothetical protein